MYQTSKKITRRQALSGVNFDEDSYNFSSTLTAVYLNCWQLNIMIFIKLKTMIFLFLNSSICLKHSDTGKGYPTTSVVIKKSVFFFFCKSGATIIATWAPESVSNDRISLVYLRNDCERIHSG